MSGWDQVGEGQAPEAAHGGPLRLVCWSDRASYCPFDVSVLRWHSSHNHSSLPPPPPPLLLLLLLLLSLDPACAPKTKKLLSQVVLRDVTESINRQAGV